MKIGYLGAGSWGFCLASLLASQGHEVVLWSKDEALIQQLQHTRQHPKLPGYKAPQGISFTTQIEEALQGIDYLVESVTSVGIRPVFTSVAHLGVPLCPIIITSKGIEQNSGLLLPEVVVDVLGIEARSWVGCLSGPSHAEEVVAQLPTSVVCSAYEKSIIQMIHHLFSTPFLRIYPNSDLQGVAFGGAMKNVIAIASGLSDGLGFGDNAKAALITRGLHEMRKLSKVKGAQSATLNGLAGLGDLCVTCLSTLSRNYRLGRLLAKGSTLETAREEVGMVAEGSYTCISALQLAEQSKIEVPITKAVYDILYHTLDPRAAVDALLLRTTKEEHL